MQLIKCPWCGDRSQNEFSYYCDEEGIPANNETEGSDKDMLERLYLRTNHIGFHNEVWQHSGGCRGWLSLQRHNQTHEIKASMPLNRTTGSPTS
jgi:heterotetrameric sarcosine oxidase delta subunit